MDHESQSHDRELNCITAHVDPLLNPTYTSIIVFVPDTAAPAARQDADVLGTPGNKGGRATDVATERLPFLLVRVPTFAFGVGFEQHIVILAPRHNNQAPWTVGDDAGHATDAGAYR